MALGSLKVSSPESPKEAATEVLAKITYKIYRRNNNIDK
jgi:hypothetical protein